MNAVVAVLFCAALFVLLGLLTRHRGPHLGFHFGEDDEPPPGCDVCDHPCEARREGHDA
jgi:hypothetical protein